MARFIVKHAIMDSEYLKAFDYENYFYNPQLSTEKEWFFIR
jgi:cytoplasmic iron level regulating protein YaaA (DUF328/UPF0246 family)